MKDAFRRIPPMALVLCVAALLPACKSAELVPKIPGLEPYRMTIQQGNNLSQEMVSQLKLGMTREQVRFVLGTPLLMDVFHADRWDYVYYREIPGGTREQRNLSVVFVNDKLARVIGDLVPPEGVAVQPTGFVPQTKPDLPAKPAAEAPKPAAESPKPAAEATKPAAETPKAAAEAPKPAAEAPKPAAESWETKQNWNTAAPEPEKQPAASDEAKKPDEKKADESAQKPAADAQEPGFFGRILQKIGL
jgi:outer membrane protein assembly factor BamE